MMLMLPMLIVADVRSFTAAVFFPQLPSEHAADVRAAATHCSWSCIHTVSSVGQRSAVTPTS